MKRFLELILTVLLILGTFGASGCDKDKAESIVVDGEEFTIERDQQAGFYHPASEEEVTALVNYARQEGKQLRVRGSAHSVAKAIYTDSFKNMETPETEINIVLDRMIDVTFDDSRKEVTVEAGCHMGEDPEDPEAGQWQKSLFYQLDQHGWALPSTGGISHQTVGGFVSTGSAGGSIQFSVADQIAAIRLVNGRGEIMTLSESSHPEKFHAAGVSMGLLGVITSVTFKCVDAFHIIGEEKTTKSDETDINMFGSADNGSKPSLREFFEDTKHARILWWPQKGVEKMEVWQGRRMTEADYAEVGISPDDFEAKPYELFSDIAPVSKLLQSFSGVYFKSVKDWQEKTTDEEFQSDVAETINLFVQEGTQEFWDTWWHGLPMDIELDDKLLPTEFTEIWIPIERTEEVMKKLLDHYHANGLSATGPYALEVYAAKGNRFWLSPSYGGDRVRINIFWFKKFQGEPDEIYFPQFWELLRAYDCRFHWGKYMPVDPEYLENQYPKWDAFLRIREEMDADEIFLTDYWRERLGLPKSRS